MSLMLRLLSVSVAVSIFSFGATDAQITKFVKKGLSKNRSIEVLSIKIIDKQLLSNPKGWEAYFVKFKLKLKRGKEILDIEDNDIIFAKGDFVSPDFIDLKTNRSIKHSLSPRVKEIYYNDEHLLFGDKNSKHKLLIFSDPNCPFCKDVVPEAIEIVKKYPKTFSLYYYHLPLLKLHPGSNALCKAMILFQKNGRNDLIEKIYKSDFDYKQKDEKKVLEEINKKLDTNLTLKEINQKWIIDQLKKDIKMAKDLMISGTPTLFIDGKKDPLKEEYKKFIPKEDKGN